jgi:hypothetical protein
MNELQSQNEVLMEENARLRTGVVSDGYEKAMPDSSPSRVPKDGICAYWKQTGRCQFAGAGKGCLEGIHPIELGKRARDAARKIRTPWWRATR